MTIFKAALNTLNLSNADAAALIISPRGTFLKEETVQGFARGRDAIPDGVWEQLAALAEQVEAATDEIVAEQGERDGSTMTIPVETDAITARLPHPKLEDAAIARATLIIGHDMVLSDAPRRALTPPSAAQVAGRADLEALAQALIAPIVVGDPGGINFLVIAIEGMAKHPYLSPDWVAHNSMYASSFNSLLDNGTPANALHDAVRRFARRAGLKVNSK